METQFPDHIEQQSSAVMWGERVEYIWNNVLQLAHGSSLLLFHHLSYIFHLSQFLNAKTTFIIPRGTKHINNAPVRYLVLLFIPSVILTFQLIRFFRFILKADFLFRRFNCRLSPFSIFSSSRILYSQSSVSFLLYLYFVFTIA